MIMVIFLFGNPNSDFERFFWEKADFQSFPKSLQLVNRYPEYVGGLTENEKLIDFDLPEQIEKVTPITKVKWPKNRAKQSQKEGFRKKIVQSLGHKKNIRVFFGETTDSTIVESLERGAKITNFTIVESLIWTAQISHFTIIVEFKNLRAQIINFTNNNK